MNPLALYLEMRKLDPLVVMDWLQGRGLVSDNAITVEDVAGPDAMQACGHLVEFGI